MAVSQHVQDLIGRHSAFWSRESVSRPLLYRHPQTMTWPPRPWPLAGDGVAMEPRRIHPQDVDVERMLGLPGREPHLLLGDLFDSVGPVFPQAWMGALIGCPIYASAYGCVTRPTGWDLQTTLARFSVEEALASPWHQVMDRLRLRAKEVAGTEFPVQQLHLRGVVDMLAANFGEAALCMLLMDDPDGVRQLADRYADLLIAVAHRDEEMRGPWQGGYLCRWRIYAPGSKLDYQADASNILSPQLYEDVLLDIERKVLSAFRYTLIHLHAVGLHVVEPLLKIPELGAIQINMDRETGVWDKKKILDTARRIQGAGKGVVIGGELSESELREFLDALDPAGLAFDTWPPE